MLELMTQELRKARNDREKAAHEREATRSRIERVEGQMQQRQLTRDTGERSCESMRKEVNSIVKNHATGQWKARYDRIYNHVADRIGVDFRVKYPKPMRGSRSILSCLTTLEMKHALISARGLYMNGAQGNGSTGNLFAR